MDINKQVYKRTSIWKYMCMNDLDLIQYLDAILGSHVNTSLRKEMQDNEWEIRKAKFMAGAKE